MPKIKKRIIEINIQVQVQLIKRNSPKYFFHHKIENSTVQDQSSTHTFLSIPTVVKQHIAFNYKCKLMIIQIIKQCVI